MKKPLIFYSLILLILGSCASVKTNRSADAETYREDLSPHRATYTQVSDTASVAEEAKDYSDVEPTNDVTAQLNEVLEGSDELRKNVNEVDGYTVQIYVGNDTDAARKAKGQALALLPKADVELYYDEPSFKVKVGKFYTINEARGTFAKLKPKFPNALILPDKIPIP